jgi:hypothetical protein
MPAQTAPSSENLLLGKGQVLFDRFDANGVSTGFRHLGNVETFELTTTDDKVQKFSSMAAGAPLYKEVNRRRAAVLTITGDEFHPENMALITMGDQSVSSRRPLPSSAKRSWPRRSRARTSRPRSSVPSRRSRSSSSALTPGVLNTDYAILNANIGLLRILPGTALTGAVTIDYTPTAYTSTNGPAVIAGGTAGVIQGAIKFIGDPSTGPDMIVDVWRANISPNGAVGLIGDDFATLSLSAAVLDDSAANPANPLYRIIYPPVS